MSTSAREARFVSRLLRWGLLLAFGVQVLWSLHPASSRALTPEQEEGRILYQTSCSSCHGLQGLGTASGPSLQGVGPAAVDFMVSTGRMPLADPADQPVRGQPRFTPPEIGAIVAYLETIAPGGPEIPSVNPANGSLAIGRQVFSNNCSACHGATAIGDSVGGGQIAPSLSSSTPTQIAEAIRVGPGVMPKLDGKNLSQSEVDSLARYLVWLRSNGDEGGLQLGRVGPIAEGLVAALVGLGLLVLVLRLTGSKT